MIQQMQILMINWRQLTPYNSDGYLIKSSGFNDGDFYDIDINIERGTDNKIDYIEYDNKGGSRNDTVFYNWQAVSGGTNITTIHRPSIYLTDTVTYEFSTDNRLMNVPVFNVDQHISAILSNGYFAYNYNLNNSLADVRFTSQLFQ